MTRPCSATFETVSYLTYAGMGLAVAEQRFVNSIRHHATAGTATLRTALRGV